MGKIKVRKITPHIEYAGSLIQQNYGETFDNHGVLVWDLDKKQTSFIPINNDYGYYTIKIKNGKLPKINDIPKFPRIRILAENTSIADLKLISAELQKKYKVKDIILNIVNKNKDKGNKINSINHIVGNITDVNQQNKLIEEYLVSKDSRISKELLKKVVDINKELNSEISVVDRCPHVWKLKKLEFSNLFSYGEDNIVDFTDMNGVYGLFASNASGKSNLISILLFVLFDKTDKTVRTIDMLNTDKDKFYAKLMFELDGKDYVIEKIGTKKVSNKKLSVKVDTNFWTYNDTGEVEKLNGEQRRETRAEIFNLIGSINNAILTAFSLQNNNAGILGKSQNERKFLLNEFVGVDIFERLHCIGNNASLELKAIIKAASKENYEQQLAKSETDYTTYQIELEKLKKEYAENITTQKTLNKEILKQTKKIVKVEKDLDIESLKTSLYNVKKTIETENKKLKEQQKEFDDIVDNVTKLNKKLDDYDIEDLEIKIEELKQLELEKNEIEKNVSNLTVLLEFQQDKLEKLKDLEYDPSCSFCMNNIFVKDAIDTKETFKETQTSYSSSFETKNYILNKYSELFPNKTRLEEYNKLIANKERYKNAYQNCQNKEEVILKNIEILGTKMIDIEENIEKYHLNEKVIEENKKIYQSIKELKDQLDNITIVVDNLSDSINSVNANMKVAEAKMKEVKKKIKSLRDNELKYSAYKTYLDVVHRDGLPFELLKRVIPVYETEVNNVLMQVADFNILMELEEGDINMYIVYNDRHWNLELSSGMERFISSIALRVGLNRISNIPRPNFLFIDEGFGSLDSDNINQMKILFDYLKNLYELIIIVSHLDIMRDMVDNIIEVKMENGFSKIETN